MSQQQSFSFHQDANGIGTLVFDVPDQKVNTFSVATMKGFAEQLSQLPKSLTALVLRSGKPHSFIAGADLHAFEPAFQEHARAEELIRLGHDTFNQLATLPFPTIALIEGACLGGGMECALACDFRLVTDHPKAQLGLPEVTLGLIPGWGGTQRLPRLVGIQKGLSMIVEGKPVDGVRAFKMGLADAVIPAEFLEEQLPEQIARCLKQKKRKSLPLLDKIPFSEQLICRLSREKVIAKTKGHYPAPPCRH